MIRVPGYRILAEVASGSSGTVYRAVQEALGRDVALKVLSPGLFDERETRARFLREAKLQASLAHPALLRLYDAGFVGERPYLVTEWIEAGTLRTLLERNAPLELEAVLELGNQIAAGLAAAHAAGIVHRDLKPENILVSADGRPHIADFGLAKAQAPGVTQHTRAGTILGTPGYIAPEVIEGAAASPPSDIYACGVILFEALSGRFPFPLGSAARTLQAQLEGVPALSRQAIPSAIERIVMRCLEREPGARPAAEQLAAALDPKGAPQATVRISMAEPAPSLPRRGGGVARRDARPALRAPASARPTLPRWPLAIVFAIGAAAAAFGLLSRWPAPPRPALLPRLTRVTTASRSARLVLDRPPRPNTRFAWSEEGSSAVSEAAIPEGALSHVIRGLRPGTAYRGALAKSSDVHFSTLHELDAAGLARLHPVPGEGSDLALASRGDRVFAVWRAGESGHRKLLARESEDGGETWTEAAIVDAYRGLRRPALLWLPSGLLLLWLTELPGVTVTAARFRPEENMSWGATCILTESAPDIVAAGAAEGRVQLLMADPPSRRARSARANPGELAKPAWKPAFELSGKTTAWKMPRAGLVILRGASDSPRGRLLWSVVEQAGKWAAPVPIGADDADRFDAVENEGAVVLAYQSGDDVRARRWNGASFGDAARVHSGAVDDRRLALTAGAGSFFLAVVDHSLLQPESTYTVYRSPDGVTWSQLSRRRLGLSSPQEVGIRATSRGLVTLVTDQLSGVAALTISTGGSPDVHR